MSVDLLEYTHEIKGYDLKEYSYEENILIARISKSKNQHVCSDCKSKNITATKINERQIKALPMGVRKFRFEVTMHRLRCHDCQAYKMEELDLTSSTFSRTTKSLERTVIELRKHMSIKAVADYFDLHWDTVKNIEKRHLKTKYEDIKLKDVKAIGIDEVFMGKSLGEKGYLTIVRDLRSGAVLFVGKGKKGSCLDPFADKLKSRRPRLRLLRSI